MINTYYYFLVTDENTKTNYHFDTIEYFREENL